MLATYLYQQYILSEAMNVMLEGYPILGRGSIAMDDTCIVSLEVPT